MKRADLRAKQKAKRPSAWSGPNPRQIQAIKTLSREAGQTDAEYRDMLKGAFGVESCKALNPSQVSRLIEHLSRLTKSSTAKFQDHDRALPFSDLEGRPDHFATPAQLRLISVQWNKVTVFTKFEEQQSALENFLLQRFKILGVKGIERHEVGGILKAIKTMVLQQAKGAKP